MANYAGYLLKFGSAVMPNKYLTLSSYNATPNQRTELSADRDVNNLLHRATSPNTKTKISFNTGVLTLNEKIALQTIIANGCINNLERKHKITYWNDENNSYITGEFYMADVTYTIMDADSATIIYAPVTFEFIEY